MLHLTDMICNVFLSYSNQAFAISLWTFDTQWRQHPQSGNICFTSLALRSCLNLCLQYYLSLALMGRHSSESVLNRAVFASCKYWYFCMRILALKFQQLLAFGLSLFVQCPIFLNKFECLVTRSTKNLKIHIFFHIKIWCVVRLGQISRLFWMPSNGSVLVCPL